MKKLKIIHFFRSPVGGIFRHVRDLIDEQLAQGHEVGIICDNNTGGDFEENMFDQLQNKLALGLHRMPMQRAIALADIAAIFNTYKIIKKLDVDIIHSHSAKAGAYARLIGTFIGSKNNRPARLYCPHGGSIHYDATKLSGRVYFKLERVLERMTDRLIFVSAYERDSYFEKVGKPYCPYSLIKNGIENNEFTPIETDKDASDFLYIGMMRDLKGVDLLLKALPKVAQAINRKVSITLVGDGPDLAHYKQQMQNQQDWVTCTFKDPVPAREAMPWGNVQIVPSRAESMPYIVLETLAAQRPLLCTHVGGIPEIYGPYSNTLIEADSLNALTQALIASVNGCYDFPDSKKIAAYIKQHFSLTVMADDMNKAYQETL